MLTDAEIEKAKADYTYPELEAYHQHNDCIRIAYEWLDAQKKTKGTMRQNFEIKHLIENWAGRYVSTSDVEVAAYIHPEINGQYPRFNISSQLTEPSINRLEGIGEAGRHAYRQNHRRADYKTQEER